MLSFSAL